MKPGYSIELDRDEEKIAQLLTRDAWCFFNTFSTCGDPSIMPEIPKMPRGGHFEVPTDPGITNYYLCFAGTYFDELSLLGWPAQRFCDACEGFLAKLEAATGLKRRAPIPSVMQRPAL